MTMENCIILVQYAYIFLVISIRFSSELIYFYWHLKNIILLVLVLILKH